MRDRLSSAPGVLYELGPFRVDTLKRRLKRGDEDLELTPKAFEILVVLIERAGQLVEKDDLMRVVWPDTVVEESNLAQQISTLRKALGETADHPEYIVTIPRRGYRLVVPVRQTTSGVESSEVNKGNGTGTPLSNSSGATIAIDTHADLTASGVGSERAGWRRVRTWQLLTLAAVTGLIGLAVAYFRQPDRVVMPIRFALPPPDGTAFSTSGGFMTVSPDGRTIAFVASVPGALDQLWVRSLEELSAHPLPGTEGAFQPFWSSTSDELAFFAAGKLKRISISGGEAETICNTPPPPAVLSGTWNSDGVILFSLIDGGLEQVPARGGEATLIASPDTSRGETALSFPSFLPDGHHYLYLVASGSRDVRGVHVGTLGVRDRKRLVGVMSSATFASGHLLWMEDGAIVARRLNLSSLALEGEKFTVAERVAYNAGTGRGVFSTSRAGVLAYKGVGESQLSWFDRTGHALMTVGSVATYFDFALSPDAGWIAADRLNAQTGTADIWLIDGRSNAERRFTFDPAWETAPIWSPDGSRVVFASNRNGSWDLYEKSRTGEGAEALVLHSSDSKFPLDWTPDHRDLIFHASDGGAGRGNWVLSTTGRRQLTPLSASRLDEGSARVSPDGRWLAYFDPSGPVFVRPFGPLEGRWQISSGPALSPIWRADGKELFYLTRDLRLMAVPVASGPTFTFGAPVELFKPQTVAPSGVVGDAFDVAPDGQRFLIKVPVRPAPVSVVVNWLQAAHHE